MHFWLLICLLFVNDSVWASKNQTLPLPRFAILRAKIVNLHVGPGKEYPVSWQLTRQGMPVEIIAEFDTWRQIRLFDGTRGWIHKSLLSGKRMIQVNVPQTSLISDPQLPEKILAYLKTGVLLKISYCQHDWCKADIKGMSGWVKRTEVWGLYPHEIKF